MRINARKGYFGLFLIILGLISYALYLQFWQNIEPCPLCVGQRVVYLFLGILSLAVVIHNPQKVGIRIYSILTIFIGGFGASIAGRQLWLQSLPTDQVPSCGPGIGYMLRNFPLNATVKAMFTGSGECAQIHWQFLSLSIAGWSLLFFLLIVLLGVGYLISAK